MRPRSADSQHTLMEINDVIPKNIQKVHLQDVHKGLCKMPQVQRKRPNFPIARWVASMQ